MRLRTWVACAVVVAVGLGAVWRFAVIPPSPVDEIDPDSPDVEVDTWRTASLDAFLCREMAGVWSGRTRTARVLARWGEDGRGRWGWDDGGGIAEGRSILGDPVGSSLQIRLIGAGGNEWHLIAGLNEDLSAITVRPEEGGAPWGDELRLTRGSDGAAWADLRAVAAR